MHNAPGLNDPQAPPNRKSQALPDARSQWRMAQDDNYCVLLHSATGTVIELMRHSKGWLQCRDCKWHMHTLYRDGHVDCPRVQVLDAEHLITQIRNDGKRSAHVSIGDFGYWKISHSEHGEGDQSRSMMAHGVVRGIEGQGGGKGGEGDRRVKRTEKAGAQG